jgi:hypothetical protein
MLGVFAEFERGIIRERVNAGLARARAKGTKLGRRRVEPAVEERILELRARGDGILKIGRQLGIGTSVVQRVFKQERCFLKMVPWSLQVPTILPSLQSLSAHKTGPLFGAEKSQNQYRCPCRKENSSRESR